MRILQFRRRTPRVPPPKVITRLSREEAKRRIVHTHEVGVQALSCWRRRAETRWWLHYKVPIKNGSVGDGGKRGISQAICPERPYVYSCNVHGRESAARFRVRGYGEIGRRGRRRWRGACTRCVRVSVEFCKRDALVCRRAKEEKYVVWWSTRSSYADTRFASIWFTRAPVIRYTLTKRLLFALSFVSYGANQCNL